MNIILEVRYGSSIDRHLRAGYYDSEYYAVASWKDYIRYLKSFPGVIGGEFVDGTCATRVEFNSEEAKTWFILRWS